MAINEKHIEYLKDIPKYKVKQLVEGDWSMDDADRMFDFIVKYKTEHDGNSPSNREIGAAVGISSTSVVRYKLDELVRRGKIRPRIDRQTRSIEVVGGSWTAA